MLMIVISAIVSLVLHACLYVKYGDMFVIVIRNGGSVSRSFDDIPLSLLGNAVGYGQKLRK